MSILHFDFSFSFTRFVFDSRGARIIINIIIYVLNSRFWRPWNSVSELFSLQL